MRDCATAAAAFALTAIATIVRAHCVAAAAHRDHDKDDDFFREQRTVVGGGRQFYCQSLRYWTVISIRDQAIVIGLIVVVPS